MSDHGRLAEQGNHELLIKRDGIYASMHKAQSHWYAEESFECSLKSGVPDENGYAALQEIIDQIEDNRYEDDNWRG